MLGNQMNTIDCLEHELYSVQTLVDVTYVIWQKNNALVQLLLSDFCLFVFTSNEHHQTNVLFIQSINQSFIHSCIHSFIHSFTHLFIYSFIHSLIPRGVHFNQLSVLVSSRFSYNVDPHYRKYIADFKRAWLDLKLPIIPKAHLLFEHLHEEIEQTGKNSVTLKGVRCAGASRDRAAEVERRFRQMQ